MAYIIKLMTYIGQGNLQGKKTGAKKFPLMFNDLYNVLFIGIRTYCVIHIFSQFSSGNIDLGTILNIVAEDTLNIR